MDSKRLLGNFVTVAVLKTKIKEAHCIKIQTIYKQVVSDNGMAVYPYIVLCRIPILHIFHINLLKPSGFFTYHQV
jgi:hypothetical protein